MVLGAVMDAGVPERELNEALAGLGVDGISVTGHTDRRGGVTGTLARVALSGAATKTLQIPEMVEIVQGSRLGPRVVERACAILRRLREAEAAAHKTALGEQRVHELGSMDTLADVVGSVEGLDRLGVERLYSSSIPSGSGIVQSEHGKLPVPSPAAAALLARARAPVVAPPGNVADAGEMVTPTGAAIVTTLAEFRQPPVRLERVGYGLGSRDSDHYPNVLALRLGEETGAGYTTDLRLVETNIDDMSPELLAYVQERLFALGARDVWFTPIQMKKNRPAVMLSALVTVDMESQAVTLVLKETTTLGVRVRPAERYEAEREVVNVETSLGAVPVKVKRLMGANVAVSPEYEACRRIASERDMPLQDVHRIVQSEAASRLLTSPPSS